jgi:hypothetical protein
MQTAVKWDSSACKIPALPATWGRWQALWRGLQLVLAGYLLLLGVGGPGLFLWSVATGNWPLPGLEGLEGEEAVDAAGQILLALGGSGFLLVLVGQWCCLFYAPQSHSAKEWMFVCVLLVVLVPLLNLAVPFVGGAGHYDVLGRLMRNPTDGSLWKQLPAGTVLQLAGGLMGVLNVFFYSQFLRGVLLRLEQGGRARAVEAFTASLGVLVGASVGVCFAPGIPVVRTPLLLGLGLAWMAALAWHAGLIFVTARRMGEVLAPLVGGVKGTASRDPRGKKGYSGVYSLFRVPAR